MTIPSTQIYVRPGWASATWNYASAAMPSGASESAVVAVAFDASSLQGQEASRGDLQYSVDGGKTWINYVLPVDGQGAYVSVTGTVWRFQDRVSGDSTTPDAFNAHYKLANGSIVTAETTVFADTQPVGLTGANDVMFTTMKAGEVVDVLAAIDGGAATGARWVIDSQSQPGLFTISYNSAVDSSARLVIADPGLLPADGLAAAVTVHYYDRYQIDAFGNPVAGTGVSRTLTYSVENGVTGGLAGFGNESKLGAATGAYSASPALAALSGGGFVAVWQGQDTVTSGVSGGAGAGLWAQLRDASGNALGSAFALTPNGDARIEGQPEVAALAGGRFAVAYTVSENGVAKVAYRVVEANGSAGAEHVLDGGASGDAAMPAIATLADGSFVVGWRSGGAVHVQQAGSDGNTIGAQKDYVALASAYSPSIAALAQGGYVVTWGEMNDGNVYASLGNPASVFLASGDGYAATITTAAPLSHVTALAGGGFVVTWDSYINDQLGFSISDIFFQLFDSAGRAVGAMTQANVESGGGRYDASVAALSDGGFVVTWQGSDDDGNGIFGRRFGADGSAQDVQEFAVNQLRSGDQVSPDVVALTGGGFATAWADTTAAGSTSVEVRVLAGTPSIDAPLLGGSQDVNSGSVTVSSAGPTETSMPVATAPVVTSPVVTSPVLTAPVVTAPVVSAPVTSTPVATTPAAPSLPSVVGTGGNNSLVAPSGNAKLDGQGGLDTALYAGLRGFYTVMKEGADFGVYDFYGSHTTLTNVERVQFADQMVALDIHGTAGEAYRLYQAAFNRTPDKAGLGYWIEMMDKGQSLVQAAAGFVDSKEFKDLYGADSSDAQFVQALYQNVLHRAAEGAGYDFWMQSLHSVSRAQVLADFSESAENQAQVIGSIQNGINYIDWV